MAGKTPKVKAAKKPLKVKKIALPDLRAKDDAAKVKGGLRRNAPVYMLIA